MAGGLEQPCGSVRASGVNASRLSGAQLGSPRRSSGGPLRSAGPTGEARDQRGQRGQGNPSPPPTLTTIIIIISRWRRPTRGLLYFQHCPSSLLPPPLLHHIWIHCRNFSFFFFFFALPSECFILFFSMMVMRTEQNNNQCRPSMGT